MHVFEPSAGAFELTYQGYELFKSKLLLIGNNCKAYNRGDDEFCKKAQVSVLLCLPKRVFESSRSLVLCVGHSAVIAAAMMLIRVGTVGVDALLRP